MFAGHRVIGSWPLILLAAGGETSPVFVYKNGESSSSVTSLQMVDLHLLYISLELCLKTSCETPKRTFCGSEPPPGSSGEHIKTNKTLREIRRLSDNNSLSTEIVVFNIFIVKTIIILAGKFCCFFHRLIDVSVGSFRYI